MIYPLIAIATLSLSLAIVLMSQGMRPQTTIMMTASILAYMATGILTGDIVAACMVLITGTLGALALDSYSFSPRVRYGVVMA